MSQIIIFPKGTLTDEDRQKAEDKGFLVIECDNPEKVTVITPLPSVAPEMMLMSALGAMNGTFTNSEYVRSEFTRNLYHRLKGKEDQKP